MFKNEIDLLAYLRIIDKKKITVLTFFTFSLLVVICFVYLMPQNYEVDSSIHVGQIVIPLMTDESAGYLLQKNKSYITANLLAVTPVSDDHLLSMYIQRQIEFVDMGKNTLKISVKDKNALRAVNLCKEITFMLLNEGKKAYTKDMVLAEQELHLYKEEMATLEKQLAMLESKVVENKARDSIPDQMELKKFYQKELQPLISKVILLQDNIAHAHNFWLVENPTYLKNGNSINLNQILAILGLGLIMGVICASFQELYSNIPK